MNQLIIFMNPFTLSSHDSIKKELLQVFLKNNFYTAL